MDLVYEMFEGTGVEHRTLDTLCRQLDMDPQHARHTLRQRGVTIRPAETLGTAARRYGVNPIALLQALLVGEEVRSGQRRIEEVPRCASCHRGGNSCSLPLYQPVPRRWFP